MNRKNLVFLLVTILVGVTLFLLPFFSKVSAPIPKDSRHTAAYDPKKPLLNPDECFVCHGPKGTVPLPQRHPPKVQCLYCHVVTPT